MASRDDIIFCDRCGAEMKKNQRCCIKCGNINYSNPENASMRKFENNSKKGTYVVGSGSTITTDLSKNYIFTKNIGYKKTCVLVNICLLIIGIIASFVYFYTDSYDILSTLINPWFNILLILLLLFFLESLSMQFIYMKANKPWWGFFIPFYNSYVYFDITMKSPWLFLVGLIPIIGQILFIVSIFKFASKFRISGILCFVFYPIVLPALAFDTAAAYENNYYIQSTSTQVDEKVALVNNYQGNKLILSLTLGLMFISFVSLIYFNYDDIVSGVRKLIFIKDNTKIVNEIKKDYLSGKYSCTSVDLASDDSVLYIDFSNSSVFDDSEKVKYFGYVKVKINNDKRDFYITSANDYFSISDVKFDSLKKFKVDFEDSKKITIPNDVIVCTK